MELACPDVHRDSSVFVSLTNMLVSWNNYNHFARLIVFNLLSKCYTKCNFNSKKNRDIAAADHQIIVGLFN